MEHIMALGHREIGVISIADGMNLGLDERTRGVYAAAEPHQHLRRVHGTLSVESGATAAEELLTAHPQLTAIVAMNDRMALGAIRQLHKMGYRVPDDISVVGFDNLPQSTEFTPTLTTIDQQFGCWGAMAMNMLLDQFAGRKPEPIVLAPQLITRQSSAAVR
jgi:DNA-binding LacI/PurR family transcriptional regulator